jgi:dolichol-phosphate mannosyltransferase
MSTPTLAVVIPSYMTKDTIVDVVSSIGGQVNHIFVIDDVCPENSGKLVEETFFDKRVKVLFHKENQGVGGAVVTGYRAALDAGADIVVKVDGDGQMDTSKISELIEPILLGQADYTKGDRFDSLTGLRKMPSLRLIGNAGLTLLTKISSGYWNIKDPTNGFTAIHADVLRKLPLSMLKKGYFFESDMLFRLSIYRAVVMDVPMAARYDNEKSNLNLLKALITFPWFHLINFHKRLFYNYYLRDVYAASIELLAGVALSWFGVIFGLLAFAESTAEKVPATTGTVMIAVLPIILGFQLLLAFISFDVNNVPNKTKHRGSSK